MDSKAAFFGLVEDHSKGGLLYGQNFSYEEMRHANIDIIDICKSMRKSEANEADRSDFFNHVLKFERMAYLDNRTNEVLGDEYQSFKKEYLINRMRGYAKSGTDTSAKTDIDTSSIESFDDGQRYEQLTFDDV